MHFKNSAASLASSHKLVASVLASLSCDKHRCLQPLPAAPSGAKVPPVENCWSRQPRLLWTMLSLGGGELP